MKIILDSIYDQDVKDGVFEVPEIVTTISDYAFSCNTLKEIVIANPKTHIRPFAFNGCNNLEEIIMPKALIDVYSSSKFMEKYKVSSLEKCKSFDDGRGGK